jgi:hypothetical protein
MDSLDDTMMDLPGADLIRSGMRDIIEKRETIASELVKIGSPRLRECGLTINVSKEDALVADRRLYSLLGDLHGLDAHARFNSLIRELVSFERSLEHRTRRAG